jgi:hypothetical protein
MTPTARQDDAPRDREETARIAATSRSFASAIFGPPPRRSVGSKGAGRTVSCR